MRILFLLFAFLLSCQSEPQVTDPTSVQIVMGRDGQDHERQPIYRLRTPLSWIRRDPLPNDSLKDTKKSLVDFFIHDNDGIIRIAIHNFPSQAIEERIPPSAQIGRWKKQFDTVNASLTQTIPQSFNGYVGLLLSLIGTQNQQEQFLLAWTLQLADQHYRTLANLEPNALQNRADITIKATGPLSLFEKYRDQIVSSARSFELIDEIPQRNL